MIYDFWVLIFPKKRGKDYSIKIRIFHHSAKELTMIFTEKRTFPDNTGQIRTIPDKYGHCALPRYYLCIVISSPQSNAESHGVLTLLIVIQTTAREEGSRVHPHVSLAMCYRDFSDKSSTTRLRFALNDKMYRIIEENNPWDSVSSVVQKNITHTL